MCVQSSDYGAKKEKDQHTTKCQTFIQRMNAPVKRRQQDGNTIATSAKGLKSLKLQPL